MQYEFLNHFPKRMKSVGLYAMLLQNSIQKTTWRQYGFFKADEQINLIFAVLLYIMEQSLKEEPCTMDDIGAYIDTVNTQHFKKDIGYEECRQLGDFILNVILCNEGKAMYFDGFDFQQNAYQTVHISYVANRVIYVDQELKRTSYYLTDDGYNLLLSTLEIENNMKLTIHEMIFQLHLEKQSYDKAVDEIKNVFNLLRIQLQKIQEAMGRIRRNALNYSVKDYETILVENLDTISDTKQKFQNYRELVKSRAMELEEKNINIQQLMPEEERKLGYLKEIEIYLNRTIDEHQRILNHHFDLKALYTRELEQLSRMSLIRRFPLRTKLYDKVLEHPAALEHLDYFLRPLFNQDGEKTYNLNKAFQLQRLGRRRGETDSEEILDFDEEAWEQEKERQRTAKLLRYQESLSTILSYVMEAGRMTLQEICERAEEKEELNRLIPTVEVFKEIMVELIKNRRIDLGTLKQEQSEYIQDRPEEFQLNDMLLHLVDTEPAYHSLSRLEISRTKKGETVIFRDVTTEEGRTKSIRCSNVVLQAFKED